MIVRVELISALRVEENDCIMQLFMLVSTFVFHYFHYFHHPNSLADGNRTHPLTICMKKGEKTIP